MACKKGCKGCYKCGGKVSMQKGGWLDSYEDGGFPLKTTGPRALDTKVGMMKARMAYGNEFGNPAAERMVSPNPNTYDFGNNTTGTHYMSSYGNYAIPELQEVNGKMEWLDNPKAGTEKMKFDSEADARYFAENYKDVAPMMRNYKANGGWLDSFDEGGHVHPHEDSQYSLPTYSSSVGSEAPRASVTTPTEKPRFETEQERFLRENAEAIRFNTPAAGTATPMVGVDDPIFNIMLGGAPSMGGKLGSNLLSEATMGATDAARLTYQVGKAGLKGAKRAADSGSQAYKDYLAKPLRKDLEPKQIKKAVIKDKDTKVMDSFKDKPSPDYTDVYHQGFDGNLITRPLTPLGKTDLEAGKQWYRKIGNEKGLRDLIEKGGAQAPKPLKMKSGQSVDVPFFGRGNKPTESYKGLYAVEAKPDAKSIRGWSSNVGGTSNYGSVPYGADNQFLKNVPLEDLNVYRKKFLSNNYRKLDPDNLEEGMKYSGLQRGTEGAFKWGARGAAADYLFNDSEYTDQAIEYVKDKIPKENKNGGWLDTY
jgi:hypothetical protein